MVDLDAIQQNTMDFTLGGSRYSVPALDSLDADELLGLVEKGSVDRSDILALFRSVIERHAPGAMEGMTLAQFRALLEAWQETGDVGESSPSSD